MNLSALDARVLRATVLGCELTPEQIGQRAGCAPDVALSCLRRLRLHYLVEPDRQRPASWLRTARGDNALATSAPLGATTRHQPQSLWSEAR